MQVENVQAFKFRDRAKNSKISKIISYHLFLKTLIYVNIENFATNL